MFSFLKLPQDVTVEQIRDIVEFELKEKEKIIEEEEQEEGDKKKSEMFI